VETDQEQEIGYQHEHCDAFISEKKSDHIGLVSFGG
jgi:hypothetical protein